VESPHHKDEVLGGGVGAGAVVTEVAKDNANDTLVRLLSVIAQIYCLSLLLFVCLCHLRKIPWGPRLEGLTGDRRR
jgi:hypothetical protein